MIIEKVKKRSGKIVDFDSKRIGRVIEKAFLATETEHTDDLIESLRDDVVSRLEELFAHKVPAVEQIQDCVEERLIARGFMNVARAYIVYRKEHEKLRDRKQKELLKKIEKSELKVVKRSGVVADFDIREIIVAVTHCCHGIDFEFDIDGIVNDAKLNIFDGITTQEINQGVLMAIKNRLERDPAYSDLAARFLINDLYKDVLGVDEFHADFEKKYENYFSKQIIEGVSSGRLSQRLLEFDLAQLSLHLKFSRDRLLAYMGAQVLYDRYFLRDSDQRLLEVPQYFWMRVAMGMAMNEKNKDAKAIEFYTVISQMLYVPSTPTLLHSGTFRPQMSSCYLTTVEDDLDHIFKCIGDNAQLSRWSGGIANDWTNIRGTGSLIKTINVPSQGVIPFLKIADSTTAAINRSGKRRGATCVYLEVWHFDIEEFLDLRKNTGDDRRRTHDTNTACWIPDLFIERVMANEEWTLFSSDETPDLHHIYGKQFREKYVEYERKADRGEMVMFKRVNALDIWRKMITMLFETGHPWITFKDPSNIRSPQDHVGTVHSSNLCTEITLNTSAEETAVCNLGSINIPRHIVDNSIDKELLKRTVMTAMRMLDNVIDINFYPTKEAAYSNLRHRPVGLGIMGLHDGMYILGMRFDSHEAVDFSDEIMEYVSYYAILASSEIAREKGTYSSYRGSKWDRGLFPIDTLELLEKDRGFETGIKRVERLDWTIVRQLVRDHGMRNSNCMAIAPTATIANISGCIPSIEPIYKNIYVKSNFSGEFTIINTHLVSDLKKVNLWNEVVLEKIKYYDGSIQRIDGIPQGIKDKYKEVFEIDPTWIILHAAHRGKWIDQSQSLNIFTTSQSGKYISDIYLDAWKKGLKTTYYLRTLGASAIEKSTLDINKKFEETRSGPHSLLEDYELPVHATLASEKNEDVIAEIRDSARIVDDVLDDGVWRGKTTSVTNIKVFEEGLCDSCQ